MTHIQVARGNPTTEFTGCAERSGARSSGVERLVGLFVNFSYNFAAMTSTFLPCIPHAWQAAWLLFSHIDSAEHLTQRFASEV